MTPSTPTALVVGAASAVGAAVSNYMAARGHRVVAVDVGLGPSGYPDQVHLDADLAHATEIERVRQETKRLLEAPDILIVALPAPADMPPSSALRSATDHWLDFTQAVAEGMVRRGEGHVVLLLPAPQAQPAIGQTLGAAAQGAMAKALAAHFASRGVRVNAIEVSGQAAASAHREVLGAIVYLEQAKTSWGEILHPERLPV